MVEVCKILFVEEIKINYIERVLFNNVRHCDLKVSETVYTHVGSVHFFPAGQSSHAVLPLFDILSVKWNIIYSL